MSEGQAQRGSVFKWVSASNIPCTAQGLYLVSSVDRQDGWVHFVGNQGMTRMGFPNHCMKWVSHPDQSDTIDQLTADLAESRARVERLERVLSRTDHDLKRWDPECEESSRGIRPIMQLIRIRIVDVLQKEKTND